MDILQISIRLKLFYLILRANINSDEEFSNNTPDISGLNDNLAASCKTRIVIFITYKNYFNYYFKEHVESLYINKPIYMVN